MSLALSNSVLFISLIKLINRVQCSNTTFLVLLFGVATVHVFATDIAPVKVIYASL